MSTASPTATISSRDHADMFEELRYATGHSTLGHILAAFSARGIVAIQLGDDRDLLLAGLQATFPAAHLFPGDSSDRQIAKRLAAHIEKPRRDLDLPLDIRGTPFQKRVWRIVQEIPLGQTTTYTEVARRIGSLRAQRAVGNACCACPLALAIPCHRVLRRDGTPALGPRSLTLLAREASFASTSL